MRRADCLAALGLGPLWRIRQDGIAAGGALLDGSEVSREGENLAQEAMVRGALLARPTFSDENLSKAMPVDPVERAGPSSSQENVRQCESLGEVAALVAACRRCVLHEQRNCAVPGVGADSADWVIVGEAPGADEDAAGEPFVGQAGKLLDAMLSALGLKRGEGVYITNSVKCRPPNNRTPQSDEIDACFPFLHRQIALIKPRIILALGRPAAQALLKQEVRIGAARGKLFRFDSIPVVVTYHPAYLLRNPEDKAKAWEDLCFAHSALLDQPARVE